MKNSNSTLNYDSKAVKDYFAHKSGGAGGLLVGKRHSEGGIKAINKSTGQPLEMEGGEVVITRNAVSDDTKREFEGEMLTNKEILSKINQGGGGVAIFEEGGCLCSGKKYKYGGETISDYDILKRMSMQDRQYQYSRMPSNSYEQGGKIDMDSLNRTEMVVLNGLANNPQNVVYVPREKISSIQSLLDDGIVYATPNKFQYEVRMTNYGCVVMKDKEFDLEKYEQGGSLGSASGQASIFNDDVLFKKGGEVSADAASGYTYYKGYDAKYKNQFEINKAIEELVLKVPADQLTPEEKNFIGYFAGYGGLEKYGAEGVGLLYEYYTPSEIAKRMWGLAYKYGYKGGAVLEPSCGIGEFIKYAPDQKLVTGYEISEVSSKICQILYPDAIIKKQYFEQIFIKNNQSVKGKLENIKKYELVIGNPPYGKMEGFYAGLGEKDYTKSKNYIEYFILRGLDLLQKDGLLIYIIGAEVATGGQPFLASGKSPVKDMIAEKATLVDAYRLPNGLFETTDVLTDIIVLKKK